MCFLPALLLLAGCPLADNTWLTFPTRAQQVLLNGNLAYVSGGQAGLSVVSMLDGSLVYQLPPAAGSQSSDALALSGNQLFVLDATAPGALTVYSLSNPSVPTRLDGPHAVSVGSYAGLAAKGNRVAIAGGTGPLLLRSTDADGKLTSHKSSSQEDQERSAITLSENGAWAYVATRFGTSEYGLRLFSVSSPPLPLLPKGKLIIPGAGATKGSIIPVNFAMASAVKGKHLIVAHASGLSVVSIGDEQKPALVKELALGIQAVHLSIYEKTAYIIGSDPTPTLVLVDIEDPEKPSVTKKIPLPSHSLPLYIAVSADYIVVAGLDSGLHMLRRLQ